MLKTGFLDPKLWMIWKKSMPKEHSFSITLPTVHFKHLSSTLYPKFVSIALNLIPSSICTPNNVPDVIKMKSLTLIKESVNPNLITLILQEWKTGISMAVIYHKLTRTFHLVLIRNLILMELFVFHVNFHFIGVCRQIFAKNAQPIKHLIWTLKNVKRY